MKTLLAWFIVALIPTGFAVLIAVVDGVKALLFVAGFVATVIAASLAVVWAIGVLEEVN